MLPVFCALFALVSVPYIKFIWTPLQGWLQSVPLLSMPSYSALANALSFFENQRDGADFISSALRTAPAHLNDQRATVYSTPEFSGPQGSRVKGDLTATGAVIDASGGWWDAGDCLKFVHTTSYAVALMLVGKRDFPNQMGAGSALSNFSKEARFGVDWLLRMWDDHSKTLHYQVGIGSGRSFENDHSVWRLPQMDDTQQEFLRYSRGHRTDPCPETS